MPQQTGEQSSSSSRRAIVRRPVFMLSDIPDVMRSRMHWPVAAALMQRWFDSPANTMSRAVKNGEVAPWSLSPSNVDERLVSMAWAMRFGRVKTAANELLRTWNSPKGLALLRERIARAKPPGARANWQVGNFSQPTRYLETTCQVNIKLAGSVTDPVDEYYAAIGRGVLKLAVSGTASQRGTGYRIEVAEYGLYLRDTYDFNDDPKDWFSQFLGNWGWEGLDTSPLPRFDIGLSAQYDDVPMDRYYQVQNNDFAAYRRQYGKGGDFVIFSDLMRFRPSQPLILDV